MLELSRCGTTYKAELTSHSTRPVLPFKCHMHTDVAAPRMSGGERRGASLTFHE